MFLPLFLQTKPESHVGVRARGFGQATLAFNLIDRVPIHNLALYPQGVVDVG